MILGCHRDSESSAADSGSELTRDEVSAQAFDPEARASDHCVNVDPFRCTDKYLLCRSSPQVSRENCGHWALVSCELTAGSRLPAGSTSRPLTVRNWLVTLFLHPDELESFTLRVGCKQQIWNYKILSIKRQMVLLILTWKLSWNVPPHD